MAGIDSAMRKARFRGNVPEIANRDCCEVKNMIKHVILWKLKDEIADKASVKAGVKSGLEGLKGVVPGLVDIVVRTEVLSSSNADLMLDSTFDSEDSLKGYAQHPAHVDVVNTKVRPFIQTRLCLDFEV